MGISFFHTTLSNHVFAWQPVNLILPFAMDLCCGACRVTLVCTYLQSDLALHSTLLRHDFLSKIMPFNLLKFLCSDSASYW